MGFEPPCAEPQSAVLPLNYSHSRKCETRTPPPVPKTGVHRPLHLIPVKNNKKIAYIRIQFQYKLPKITKLYKKVMT